MLPTTQILEGARIDRNKWDACVERSTNGLVYSRFDYLTHMCDKWYGLVIGDYQAVMGLPWRQKFGIGYVYQPAFIQQLGFIGEDVCNSEVLALSMSFVKYGNVLLNYRNTAIATSVGAEPKMNFVIDLGHGYEKIESNYRKDLVANLKKAKRNNDLRLIKDENIALAVSVYRDHYHHRVEGVSRKDYDRFLALSKDLHEREMCFTREVRDSGGALLAIGLFLKDGKRIYNMMNTTTDAGRPKEANHFLLDAVIREFAGQSLLFDFEGSDLPGVRDFYTQFRPVEQPYFLYHHNKLSLLLRLFKR